MADCGTELRTSLAPAPDGKPADSTVIMIITATGYFSMTMAQLWDVLDALYAAEDHNHSLVDLEDIEGEAEDGNILMYDAENNKVQWVAPQWMAGDANFDNRYVSLSPINLTLTENTSFEIPAGRKLEDVVVLPTGNLDAFAVGTALGAEDIMPGIPIGAGTAETFTLKLYANGPRTIWFNGITAETNVKIYLW